MGLETNVFLLLLLSLLLLVVLLGVAYLFYPAYTAARCRPRPTVTKVCSSTGSHSSSSSSSDKIVLSLIIPAYNEELRLAVMLQEAYDYLSSKNCKALQQLSSVGCKSSSSSTTTTSSATLANVEWLLVDDGSTDQTGLAFTRFVQSCSATHCEPSSSSSLSSKTSTSLGTWKLVTLPQNCGKGAAVQAGMLQATGSYLLMVDADGATGFGVGLEALTNGLSSSSSSSLSQNTIRLGSRAHIQKERSLVRRFLAAAFRTLLTWTLGRAVGSTIQDTQCGFKLFPAKAARRIFAALHLQRWAFDIEVLYLAAVHFGYPVQEVVVPWHEVEGSKLHTSVWNLAWVSLSMLRDMVCVRLCYVLGIWSADGSKVTGTVASFTATSSATSTRDTEASSKGTR